MNHLMTVAASLALLGSAVIAGVFFAFSSFIMRALADRPAEEGHAAMQSINVVVLNRSFLGTFIGTALISVLVGVFAVLDWDTPSAPWFLTGALFYVLGTFAVTARGNVPLNDQLAATPPEQKEAGAVWANYLDRWTMLNTVRTAAALAAALAYLMGLLAA